MARARWGVLTAIVAVAAPWWNIPGDQADSAGMLAHLHAHFYAFDLLYGDAYVRLSMSPLFAFVTDQGVVSNHWPTGATWLQAPGYVLGLAAAAVLDALGVARFDPLGLVPTLGVRALAGLVLGWGMWQVATVFARAGHETRAGLVAAWGWLVGTPLLYYGLEAPLRPHLWGASCVLGLVLVWRRSPGGSGDARAVALGGLAGLAAAVRPQLVPLVVLAIVDAWGPLAGGDPRSRSRWRRLALTLAAFAPWPLLYGRMAVWMYGLDGLGDAAAPVTHHLGPFLGSWHHGLLSWTPLVGVGLVAMGRAAVLRERGAWVLGALVIHQIWIDAGTREITPFSVLGTRTWAGGVGFGARKFVDVLPLMLPAMVSLVAAARARGWSGRLAALVMLASLPTALLHVAAFVDPNATTGAVLDGTGFLHALGRGSASGAFATAWSHRALPLGVPLAVFATLIVPCVGLGVWLHIRARARGRALGSRRTLASLGVGLCVLAHVTTSVLMVRSDARLVADPARIRHEAATFNPRHLVEVARIEAHHQLLAERVGEAAVP